MKQFCSKDCPDLCEFDISKDGKIVPYVRKSTQIASVCGKLKGFYKREMLTTDSSYLMKDSVKYFQNDDLILQKLALFLLENRHKKILFLRGSGSLGYNMGYWDLLFSHFNNCYFVDGSPCDETGISAQLEDFGICMNPNIENLQMSKSIILFGKNAHTTSRHLFLYLKKLKQNHKTIIYIDPIKTKTSLIADRYIRIEPASDGLLAAAVLSKKGLIRGFDHKKLIDHIGISEDDLLYLCDNIVDSRTSFIMGTGLQRYANGKNTVQWIDRLAYYTHNIDSLYYGRPSLGNFKKLVVNRKHKVNIAKIVQYLKDNFFDIIVVAAGNPVITYPESSIWEDALKSTPLIVVDTNITQTAQYADFFIKVGGMFTQADAQGSYFFNVDAKREKFSNKFPSDTDVIKKLSQLMNLDIKIKNADDIHLKTKHRRKTFIDKKLLLKYPKTNKNRYRIITSSNYFYLNSQNSVYTKNKDNFIYISEKIAEDNDISDGDKIILKNETGSIAGICRISDIVNNNTVMIYKNRNLNDGHPNKIIKSLPTDSRTGIAYYDTFATIKKYK